MITLDYNQLKLLILQVLFKTGPTDSGSLQTELARSKLADVDIHALRMALMRYHRQGLLKRDRRGGTFLYALSERGIQRLRWLESK